MPLFQMRCEKGHTFEVIRHVDRRDAPTQCHCGAMATRDFIGSMPHVEPDGIYSYAPNLGCPERFERQRAAIKDGVKVIPRSPHARDMER